MATIIAAPIVASWAQAAQRVQTFIKGGARVSSLWADVATCRKSEALMSDLRWRTDVRRAEEMLRAQEAEAEKARRRRHEQNCDRRAEENRQLAKLGGSASKKKH